MLYTRNIERFAAWVTRIRRIPFSGWMMAIMGTLLITVFIALINQTGFRFPSPGLLYLPLVGMLAYHWRTRHALLAALIQLFCVYFFFLQPYNSWKINPTVLVQILTLAGVTGFVLVLVQLAASRRVSAERSAVRLSALNRVGAALSSELDEGRLLHMIAETACSLTGAGFAAFTLRPTDEMGHPTVPSEGHLFHLAAVYGVTKEQEQLFRRVPLGGEGLLAPIFRQGVSILVSDALDYLSPHHDGAARDVARKAAHDYAAGIVKKEGLRSLGVPRGHPMVRSFLGVPLLDRNREVRGGLLLGHIEPDKFTQDHERIMEGLAAQAAVALDNARLYRITQMRALELNTIFESIADGVTVVDAEGNILRQNDAANQIRERLQASDDHAELLKTMLQEPAQRVLRGEYARDIAVYVPDEQQEQREYLVNASPMQPPETISGPLLQSAQQVEAASSRIAGVVVVWHDVTEARRLLVERRARAETEARLALLQLVLDELPGSVYLVRGRDARLVMANRSATTVWGAEWPRGQTMQDFLQENDIRIFANDGLPLPDNQLATLRAVQHGETVRQHQEVIRHADGTSLPVLVHAVPIAASLPLPEVHSDRAEAAANEPAAIVVHQDVTALKEAEQLKDEFIGIAAHELRTPLAVVKGFAQTLIVQSAKGKGGDLVEWQVEALQGIEQATQRLVELTEDLLDVTRLQGGRLTLHIVPTDLVALSKRVLRKLQLTTNSHTLKLHSCCEHLIVDVDPHRMEQVMGNLIGNAIKYSPEGGPVELTLQEEQEKHAALLTVKDYGIGIPENQQAQLFGRFVRADNAREHGIGGTGLGLYLCRELVERQCGRIWFESTEGKGSTFYVSLPLTQIE